MSLTLKSMMTMSKLSYKNSTHDISPMLIHLGKFLEVIYGHISEHIDFANLCEVIKKCCDIVEVDDEGKFRKVKQGGTFKRVGVVVEGKLKINQGWVEMKFGKGGTRQGKVGSIVERGDGTDLESVKAILEPKLPSIKKGDDPIDKVRGLIADNPSRMMLIVNRKTPIGNKPTTLLNIEFKKPLDLPELPQNAQEEATQEPLQRPVAKILEIPLNRFIQYAIQYLYNDPAKFSLIAQTIGVEASKNGKLIKQLAILFRKETYPLGTVVFGRQKKATCFGILCSGTMDICHINHVKLLALSAGDTAGIEAMIEETYTANYVVSSSSAECYVVRDRNLERFKKILKDLKNLNLQEYCASKLSYVKKRMLISEENILRKVSTERKKPIIINNKFLRARYYPVKKIPIEDSFFDWSKNLPSLGSPKSMNFSKNQNISRKTDQSQTGLVSRSYYSITMGKSLGRLKRLVSRYGNELKDSLSHSNSQASMLDSRSKF